MVKQKKLSGFIVSGPLLISLFCSVAAFMAPSSLHASDEIAIRHNPRSNAASGMALLLEVAARDPASMVHMKVFYRLIGSRYFTEIEFNRLPNGNFAVEIPGEEIRKPGLEYYLFADAGSLFGYRFANADNPHRVVVMDESPYEQREDILAAYDGRRSRFSLAGDYANYGRAAGSGRVSDPSSFYERFFALEMDFTYRFLTRLHSLRFGAVRLTGDTFVDEDTPSMEAVGYIYGFTEVWLNTGSPGWGFAFELQLGANHERFTSGAGCSIRIGSELGTNLTIRGTSTYLVGMSAEIRLQWDTVPGIPMTAIIETTTWPENRTGGLRLRYQAEFLLLDGFSIIPEIAYQARSARFGRLGGGMRIAYAF